MGNLKTKLLDNMKDLRHLGLSVFRRFVSTPNQDGYTMVKTRYGEFFIRRADSDFEVIRQVFSRNQYDLNQFHQGKKISSFYEAILQQGNVPLIIDAGANAGFSARFFALKYPRAHIICVEPDPDNAAICRANTSELSLVNVVEAAIGSRPGRVSMERGGDLSWGLRTQRAESGPSIVTVDELIQSVKNSKVLIVKVDIEGFENDLFAENIGWISQTPALIVEPHDWLYPSDASSRTLQQAMLGEDRDLLISGENLIWIQRN